MQRHGRGQRVVAARRGAAQRGGPRCAPTARLGT